MTRIFNDNLQPDDCDGLYTLQGYVNGQWQDIHTIAGVTSGNIEVDVNLNLIDVNITTYVPGQSYIFRWVDGTGVLSNTRVIYIAAAILAEDTTFVLNETGGLLLLEY